MTGLPQPSTSPSWADVDEPEPPAPLDTVEAVLAHCAAKAADELPDPGPLDGLAVLDELERVLPWAVYRAAWERLEVQGNVPETERVDFTWIEQCRAATPESILAEADAMVARGDASYALDGLRAIRWNWPYDKVEAAFDLLCKREPNNVGRML